MNRQIINALLIIMFILTFIPNFMGDSKGNGTSSTFIDFNDFLQQYNSASSEDRPTLRNDYITWQTDHGGFPVILNNTHVVFIYYTEGGSSTSCDIAGDFNGWNPNLTHMTRLEAGVNFFYRQMQFEPTARLDYKFVLSGENWIIDPRNPHTVSGGFGPNSELAMPQFVQPTEIIYRPSIPHGNLTTLGGNFTTPRVQVYLPPNYNAAFSYPSIYTSDGSEYISLGSAVKILDNLIADKRMDPVIAVFIDPFGNRTAWYECNSSYLTYLDAVVEYIDTTYATNQSAFARLHLGDSMGGLVSMYVALERPEKFRLIGSHSGAFWMGGTYGIKEKFENADNNLRYRCWFSAGTYESTINIDTQEMVLYCVDHGWQHEVMYLYEGHSWGSWRHTLDNMLEFFFPYTPPITTTSKSFITGPGGEYFVVSFGFGILLQWFFRRRQKYEKMGIKKGEKS